jgi:hypothetical protein
LAQPDSRRFRRGEDHRDPLAEILRERARRSSPPPLPEVLGTDLDATLLSGGTLAEQFGSIQRHGIDATLQAEAG